MAFTFTNVTNDPVTGLQTITATVDTNSAAGTFYIGFKPRYIVVYQETTPAQYEWVEGMTAAYMKKTIANGTMTQETSNGITVVATTSVTAGQGPWAVTLGTGCHTNSAAFRILCFR